MITKNNSGTSLFHYSKRVIAENQTLDFPMTRYKRRKLERKIKKKVDKYLNENANNC